MNKDFVIIKEKSKLDDLIKSIAERGKILDGDIHQAGCSAIAHNMEHGDNTYCTKLVNAMSKGMRKNSLIQWFESYGAVKWEGKGQEARFVKNAKAKINLEKAIETPFYEGKSSEGVEWNARKSLQRMLQLLEANALKAAEHKNPKLAKKFNDAVAILVA